MRKSIFLTAKLITKIDFRAYSQGLDHFLAKERERTKDRRMMTEEGDSMADQSIDIDDLKSRITKIKEYL